MDVWICKYCKKVYLYPMAEDEESYEGYPGYGLSMNNAKCLCQKCYKNLVDKYHQEKSKKEHITDGECEIFLEESKYTEDNIFDSFVTQKFRERKINDILK